MKKQSYKGIILLFTLFLLSACNLKAEKEETVETYDLPTVEMDYSDEEIVAFNNRVNQGEANQYEGLNIHNTPLLTAPEELPPALFYDSGVNIPYPEEGVKGVYVPASVLEDPEYYQQLLDYVDQTALNAMVIDFKDDLGQIVSDVDSDNKLVNENSIALVDFKKILKDLEERQIYPIARIVTFKDNLLSTSHPEYSFKSAEDGEIWQDGNGAQFINPFMQEVWDYNVAVAIEAAKMGFKEIQFDYIRFPEGFETFSDTLEYNLGDYEAYVTDDPELFGQERVYAINDFLEYANERIAPFGADVSADVFGYTAIAGDAADVRGIGQNFSQMAERVDVISSMIYPSHWDYGFFGLESPDLFPYEVVDQYMYTEKELLSKVTNPATSRPWLQDFTDSGLDPGTYQEYGAQQVQEQIVALHEYGIHEFLLWNAGGFYTEGVDYAPEITGNEFYY
ncbi:putative glycoside hydrolase [Facklamia lactis]|uniref:putative glycoside hydrolase n=1 Tax=Facklamia lactis TaxID=2749967 RepID=UPI001C555EBF|nr:putative glycoside hydrolase [Facklamia lactis]